MEAFLYAFSGNNMFTCPPTKPFWYTPEILKSTAFTCYSQKPTASSLVGYFEKQRRDMRIGRTTGEHGVFFNPFVFLPDFGMNNQPSMAKIWKSAKGGGEDGEAVFHH